MAIKPKTVNRLFEAGRISILACYLLAVILPIYWMVITSFKTHPEIINAQEITYFPRTFTIENYKTLFDLMNYGTFLKNSLILSIGTGLLVVMLSILGGYAFARYEFKAKSTLLIFFLVTQMIPGILVIIPMYIVFAKLQMLMSLWPLFIFYVVVNLPFCVITMRSFFERIPPALEEAAKVDGCGKMGTLFRVVLPVMFPGIVAVFVFAFIGAWNELIAGTIFTSVPDQWTIPVGLKSLIGKYDVKWGALMAGGVMALVPTALMFIFVQRFVVEGLTSGSVKE